MHRPNATPTLLRLVLLAELGAAGAAPFAPAAEEVRPMMPVTQLCDLRELYDSGLDGNVLARPTSQALAGQAFLVRNGPQPRLYARLRFDVAPLMSSLYSACTPVYQCSAIDCGAFAAGDAESGLWDIDDCSWTFARMAFGENTFFTVSRIAPAFLLETAQREVSLLRPANWRYGPEAERRFTELKKTDWRLGNFQRWPDPRAVVPELVPGRLALVFGGEVRVYAAAPADGLVELPDACPAMDEPWILVWNGGIQPPMVPPAAGENGPKYAADMPWLFILQRRAVEMSFDPGNGLVLGFAGEAGSLVGLPLFGNRMVTAGETAAWSAGLPDSIAALCRRWTRCLRHFPLDVDERARLAPNGDVVITETFRYADIADDWNTPGTKCGFLPPMLTVAAATTEAVGLSASPAGFDAATYGGDVQAVESETYEVTLKLGAVFDKTCRPARADVPAGAASVMAQLEAEIDWVLARGHLAPYFPFVQKLWAEEWLHVYPCWSRPEAQLRALMFAYPHLDAGRQARLRDYIRAEFAAFPPATTAVLPPDQGVRRESFPCEPHIYASPEYLDLLRPHRERLSHVAPQTWYALWQYASETGDWDYIRSQWAAIRDRVLEMATYRQWDSLGLLDPPMFTLSGSSGDVNSAAAGFLGAARLARAVGDKAAEESALIMAARLFVCRLACENYYDFAWERLTPAPLRDGTHPDAQVCRAAAKPEGRMTVRELHAFGPIAWPFQAPFGQSGLDVTFMHMCPELARAMMLFAPDAVGRYETFVRRNYLMWHASKSPTLPIRWEENPFAAPQPAWAVFQMYAFAFEAGGPALADRLDIPWCRGDWFHIEKLAHTLTAFKGREWLRVADRQDPGLGVTHLN